jgi:hypothetical protein
MKINPNPNDPRVLLLYTMVNAHIKALRQLGGSPSEMLPVAERLVAYLKELDAVSPQTRDAEPTP